MTETIEISTISAHGKKSCIGCGNPIPMARFGKRPVDKSKVRYCSQKFAARTQNCKIRKILAELRRECGRID